MKIKKILLIAPSAYTHKYSRDINPLPPMGLGYLASIAENMGLGVEILDCLVEGWNTEEWVGDNIVKVGLSNEDLLDRIKRCAPDLIGVNCQFSRQYKIYYELFSAIKSVNKDIVVVAGGAHATVCPGDILADDNCDFVVMGEGEVSFRDLLNALNKDQNFSAVDGLGWKDDEGLHLNPKKKFVEVLDDLPFPAYHLMHMEKYFGLSASHGVRHKERFSPIITSRGCPARCTFCSVSKVWGRQFRYRSVDSVLEEMHYLKDRYSIEEIMFEDDNVTANPKRAKALFRGMIESGFGFVWDTPNGAGVWTMDEEMIDLMKASGCVRINFPVESGSRYVLREIIRKPVDLSRVKNLIDYCRQIGLDYGLFFVVGMPGEKISDIWATFRFSASCRCYNPHISVATPYPGTALFDECKEAGYLSSDFKMDDLYIRSYAIRTRNWSPVMLKLLLVIGRYYLLSVGITRDPSLFKYYLGRMAERFKSLGVMRRAWV